MEVNKAQDEIIEEFSIFDDWMDKYSYLIELGNDLPELDPKYKTDNNLIEGCQSKVWFFAEYIDGNIIYYADSDAIITKGIASLLIRVLSNQKPQDILDANLYFIEKVGIQKHLSPTRSNGLLAMIKQMKLFAMALQKVNEKK